MSDISKSRLDQVTGGATAPSPYSGNSCQQLLQMQATYSRVVDNKLGFHRWEYGRRLPQVNQAIAEKGCATPPARQ
jgi:hypothetical protein